MKYFQTDANVVAAQQLTSNIETGNFAAFSNSRGMTINCF